MQWIMIGDLPIRAEIRRDSSKALRLYFAPLFCPPFLPPYFLSISSLRPTAKRFHNGTGNPGVRRL